MDKERRVRSTGGKVEAARDLRNKRADSRSEVAAQRFDPRRMHPIALDDQVSTSRSSDLTTHIKPETRLVYSNPPIPIDTAPAQRRTILPIFTTSHQRFIARLAAMPDKQQQETILKFDHFIELRDEEKLDNRWSKFGRKHADEIEAYEIFRYG